jgi:hypothetical protein
LTATSTPSPDDEAKSPSSTTAFVSLTGPSQPEATPAAARPPREGATDRGHPTAFRADFKLPFIVASLLAGTGVSPSPFAPVPQVVLGLQTGRVGLGAGFGFTSLGESSSVGTFPSGSGPSQSLTELLIAPTFTFDGFQSDDGKVAFYFLGAPLFGILLESNQSAQSDFGFQFAFGASYALHDNFRIGMEAGPVGHFYSTSGGDTYSSVSLYSALVATFAYPR